MEDIPIIPGFKLISKVGDGGMATVWQAWDNANNRAVAIKILRDEFASNDAEVRSFCTEERLLEEIRHPGVVQAYNCSNVNGMWFYVMEFVDGYTFADLLRRKQHIKESDCLLICESVAAALDSAWNDHGIVHCDIKPENIMINSEGIVKLTDLGISHRFEDTKGPQDVPEHVLGTPAYISPEQVYGDVELDCRADIYSLAATLYHLSTGRLLFPGLGNDDMMRAHCDGTTQANDPRTYRPELTESFCRLLEAMLVKDRDGRIASWADVFETCRDIERGVQFKVRDATNAPSSIRLI